MTKIEAQHIQPGVGIYTMPDAARILKATAGEAAPSVQSLRRWVSGYWRARQRRRPAGELASWEIEGSRSLSFHTLVEVFVIGRLRESGVPMRTIRKAREELSDRYDLSHPFATSRLLSDGKKILLVLDEDSVLRLDQTGVREFKKIIEQFCRKIEFDPLTDLAARIRPLGHDSDIVVDPDHAFGRPVIDSTNIPTETIFSYIKGGETAENVAAFFDLTVPQVEEAIEMEARMAA